MQVPRLNWHPLVVNGEHNPAIREATRDASGAYAVRVKRSGGVVYVGESSQGVMWKTITRHFNAPETFKAPKPKGGGNAFAVSSPGDYEIAWRVTSRGHRTAEQRDERAKALEGRWIAAFFAAGEPLKNDEIPIDADAFDFGANVRNPGDPPIQQGDRVAWRTSTREHEGRVRSFSSTEATIGPWFSRRPGGKQWTLEAVPTTTVPRSMLSLASGFMRIEGHAVMGPVFKAGRASFVQRSTGPGKPWLRFLAKADDGSGAKGYWVTAYKTKGAAMLGEFGTPEPKTDRSAAELLRAVEAGPAHQLPVSKLSKKEQKTIEGLAARGVVARLPPRGRWADRYVVTTLGSYELGSFESDDPSFRADAREAGALARERAARLKAAPSGFGAVESKGKAKGQLRMFNPKPEGALTKLGALTRLELRGGRRFAWSLRQAPDLAYDDAGRLFIVYTGKIVRSSTPAELREYGRTHWGQRGAGKVRTGGVAVGPFVELGRASSITYTTMKGTDSALTDYVHPFGEGAPARGFVPPVLAEHECVGGCGPRCAARGSIALHGGSYRVTSRGIVG